MSKRQQVKQVIYNWKTAADDIQMESYEIANSKASYLQPKDFITDCIAEGQTARVGVSERKRDGLRGMEGLGLIPAV